MGEDLWAGLADKFVDGAYATVKGYVRTHVLHQHLLEHLAAPPASVLDVGGGAGNQSFPLAQAGYEVTLLDPSAAMLEKARERLDRLPAEAQRRVTLVQAQGEAAGIAVDGRRFDAVLCHGVLGYLSDPAPMIAELCRCTSDHGVVSIMTGNARASVVRPAMERRWEDALASFDARTEIGVLGVPGRADTVEELSALLRLGDVEPLDWYGGYGSLLTGSNSPESSSTPATPSRWRPRQRWNWRPADATRIANSAASSISWDASVRTDRGDGPHRRRTSH